MIFNNGHEDCKKLTPEVVNTETGKYLHQFEWTDKYQKYQNGLFLQKDMIQKKLNGDHLQFIIQEADLGLKAWIHLKYNT